MTNKIEDTSFQSGLPSYKRPPVNEVVCGMRFQPPENLRIPHIGLLWNKFRANYPKLQHAPPLSTAKGELLVDPTLQPTQKINILQLLFGLNNEQATAMINGSPITV